MRRHRKPGRLRSRKIRRAIFFVASTICVAIAILIVSGGVLHSENPPIAEVGIVDQFYSEDPSFTDRAVHMLEELNVTYNVHRDAEVTVELFRKLPTCGYRILVLRVHSGVFEPQGNATFLFTNEPYSKQRYLTEQLSSQITPGVFDLKNKSNPVFSVGPRFVRESMVGNFRNATIILSSCYGMTTSYLAEAFVGRGASSFVGWDYLVSLEHTDRAALLLLEYIVKEQMPVNEAADKVADVVGADPEYGSVIKHYP